MSRTDLFRRVLTALNVARFCNDQRVSTRVGLEMIAERRTQQLKRRMFLAAAGGSLAACTLPDERVGSAEQGATIDADIGIVGGGLAGLACADALSSYGIDATIHEASNRVGGRCWSLRGKFPGQVAERGGELIDNLHKTMLSYANQFGLVKEDIGKQPGEELFHFFGEHVDAEAVVEEYRDFVDAMRPDLQDLSPPTADSFTPSDRALDYLDLASYLDSRGAGPVIKAALDSAYTIEYGLEISQQSCLNLLLFIHADRRSRFQPFGVYSDERYHLVGGNDAIVQGLRDRLTGPVLLGRRLVKAQKRSDGRVQLTFKEGSRTVTATHDAVVFAIPFSTLRDVELDPSLGLPAWKKLAIDNLTYGTNTKVLLGFDGRPWRTYGSNGSAYADLPSLQNTWETNPTNATAARAVLTNYTGGRLGASLTAAKAQPQAEAFLVDFDKVYPGASDFASRNAAGNLNVHVENWSVNPLQKGSYTCNRPGYFTTICENEAKPIDNLYFAGEHTSSFYEWQGFMEGAALSGLRAADEIRRDFGPG